MSSFLSLTILSFTACRTLHKLKTAANMLAKVVAEEAPGTLSSLKLSFLEINDLTSQLNNLRKRITISRFGNEASPKTSSRTGWPKYGDTWTILQVRWQSWAYYSPKILDQMIHASHSTINMNIISLLAVASRNCWLFLPKKSLLAVAVRSSFCLANMLPYK